MVTRDLQVTGAGALASYLVTSSNGLILINSDLEQNVPQIKVSIEQLGFTFSDVKILLISHAHFDHDAGIKAYVAEREHALRIALKKQMGN